MNTIEQMHHIKAAVISAAGIIGGGISYAFGGWSDILTVLICVMGVDYVTGLIVAGVFKKSGKSEEGSLESRAGFKGLARKGVILALVLVASWLDMLAHTTFVRDCVATAFIANEMISILENAGLMGIPIPAALRKAIDVLSEKADEGEDSEDSQTAEIE